jgi:CheY-like chemotaxis protein
MRATKINPRAKPRVRTGPRPTTPAQDPAEILMIEDSSTDAELAVRALRRGKIGNSLQIVGSAEHALDYLLGTGAYAKRGPTRPLLILLDLQLPGMSGLDFLRQIKRDERLCEIPVASLSPTRSAPAIVMCLQLGVADHIIKPVDYAALVRVTKRLKLQLAKVPDEVPTQARP